MPFVNIRTIKGLLTEEEKTQLKEKVTDALVAVEGGGDENFRNMVWVLIDEAEPGNWQVGNLQPTPEFISQFVESRPRG